MTSGDVPLSFEPSEVPPGSRRARIGSRRLRARPHGPLRNHHGFNGLPGEITPAARRPLGGCRPWARRHRAPECGEFGRYSAAGVRFATRAGSGAGFVSRNRERSGSISARCKNARPQAPTRINGVAAGVSVHPREVAGKNTSASRSRQAIGAGTPGRQAHPKSCRMRASAGRRNARREQRLRSDFVQVYYPGEQRNKRALAFGPAS